MRNGVSSSMWHTEGVMQVMMVLASMQTMEGVNAVRVGGQK